MPLIGKLNELSWALISRLSHSENSFCNEDLLSEQLQSASKTVQETFRPAVFLAVRTGSDYVPKLIEQLAASSGTQRCLLMLAARQAFKLSAQRLVVEGYDQLPEIVEERLKATVQLGCAVMQFDQLQAGSADPLAMAQLEYT